jgi:hypothetical protein
VVRSSGEAGEGELRSTIRVLVERTPLSVIRPGSGSTRTVTATLNVAATTDRNGRAVATVPTGVVVDVVFAGRSGFLSASTARTTA